MLVYLFILTGFRSESVGNDTHVYLDLFKYTYSKGINKDIFLEMGYQYYCLAIGKIFRGDGHAFLIVSALLCYAGLSIQLFKHSKNYYLSTCLAFLFCFSLYTNIIRQALAMTIGLFAYDYIITVTVSSRVS